MILLILFYKYAGFTGFTMFSTRFYQKLYMALQVLHVLQCFYMIQSFTRPHLSARVISCPFHSPRRPKLSMTRKINHRILVTVACSTLYIWGGWWSGGSYLGGSILFFAGAGRDNTNRVKNSSK